MTTEATKCVKVTTFGISLNASTATGVAWNNFDRFVKTKSGEDTLRNTVGIAYQVLDDSQLSILENNQERENSNGNTNGKRENVHITITPYRKKPKFVRHGMLELNNTKRLNYEKICAEISSPTYKFICGWQILCLMIMTQH